MGVYIPGMEMPQHCFGCSTKVDPDTRRCNIDGHKFEETLSRVTSRRDEACPLVPVSKHGRLGDLDAAVGILERLRDHCGNEDMAYALNWAANTIKDLPTIIPAEDDDLCSECKEKTRAGQAATHTEKEET